MSSNLGYQVSATLLMRAQLAFSVVNIRGLQLVLCPLTAVVVLSVTDSKKNFASSRIS